MPAMSRGTTGTPSAKPGARSSSKPSSKVRTPKHTKGGTVSSRNHRFQGFSQRIAKLKIEPVRRGRSTIIDDAELESTFSYFRDSFFEWKELCLAENFVHFSRKVSPLCDSLPQVLHHSDRIVDLLVEFIEKGEKFSEEPLLSLLAHLAHDLGEQFEKHFERVVKTVAHLAATHAEIEVIEWSFTCLAWLFKYLSRLLVPDLRPTFDLISPLLGRAHQKAFVARFAAESLSFLVRKAGAGYHRDKTPLKLIVRHISEQMKELQDNEKDHEFQQGIMFLLADSLKGIQRGTHSSATAIFQALLTEAYDEDYASLQAPPLEAVLVGVTTAVIHHTDRENFKPILDALLAQILSADTQHAALSSRLLFIVCGVRKGTRIADWKPVFGSLEHILSSAKAPADLESTEAWDLLSATTVVFQYCALDAAIPYEKLLEGFTKGSWDGYFLPFCNMFAELGAERFKTLLLPYFKRFVAQKAHEHGPELCIILPKLYQSGTISAGAVHVSDRWQPLLDNPFKELSQAQIDEEDLARSTYHCSALLDALEILAVPEDKTRSIWEELKQLLGTAVKVDSTENIRKTDIFVTGQGFQYLVDKTVDDQTFAVSLWPLLCQSTPVYAHSLLFWKALLALMQKKKSVIPTSGPHMDLVKRELMRCLSSPSHELRLTAIYILEIIAGKNEELRDIISVAMMIEQTPLDLENQRSISMRIGQLAKLYPDVCGDEWVGEALPTFCFGLLHVRMASAWDDTCAALKAMCNTKEGEGFVSQIAFQWLGEPESLENSASGTTKNSTSKRYANEFECTNVFQLQDRVANNQELSYNIGDKLEAAFDEKHSQIPFINAFSRTQALRLLSSIPQIAEKRSRLLVPVLLDWALDLPAPTIDSDDLMQIDAPETSQQRWSRKDQKAMLSVFSKFNNPRVLYRSSEVRDALLVLLSNGDVEIQKAALQALLMWKDRSVSPYQEELLGLLDDQRFRDELPIFLSEGKIQDSDLEEVLPIILRLLYGKVIAGKRGLESKRKSVFVGLKNRFGDSAIHQFLSIAFGPLSGASVLRDNALDESLLRSELIDARKQVGILNMLDDLLSTFKTTFNPFIVDVVDPVMYCLVKASRDLQTATSAEEQPADDGRKLQVSLLRTIRQRALHSLARLFESCPEFDWYPYTAAIVQELVEPRLEQFAIETAQSISGLLRLFASWSKATLTVPFLVEHNKEILIKTLDILDVPSAKDEVKQFVLDEILRNIFALITNNNEDQSVDEKLRRNRIHTDIIQPYSNAILNQVGGLLRKSPSKEVLESGVLAIAELAPHVVGSTESRSMIEIATFLIRQPSKRVSPRTKLGLLKILHEFIQRCDTASLSELFDGIYDAVCPMFAFFQDRAARIVLCEVIQDLSDTREELTGVAKLCQELNSFAKGRVDEPDFERRSQAFNQINEQGYQSFSLMQWKPLVYNMLYFIKDNEELSIRVNASSTLRRFIEVSQGDDFKEFITSAIIPGIQHGVREPSELVRTEFLAVTEQLVKVHRDWAPVADLFALVSDDEEASFFSNILHIQGHRRLRALRRLAANASHLQPKNTYHILLPLLEHFVFNKADDDSADNLAGETIRTLAALVEWLEWPQFRSLFKRYIGYLTSKEDMQKAIVRLIGGLMDGLNQAGRKKGYVTASQPAPETDEADETSEAIEAPAADVMDIDAPSSTLSKTLPQQDKLTKDLVNNFLPDLTAFLHKKDEATTSLRVPVAVALTKVLLVLPTNEIEGRLPGVLLDICHILKSRTQESRDQSRKTLSEIAVLTGPTYIGFILKALRTALQRGYQLHVLSFTLHYILVNLASQLKPGDLDYCVADIVDIVMDDTFGVTGQEKDAEEYISKMKEVKSSKSFDTMDIVSRSSTPAHLIKLVNPIKALLLERINAKMVQKIDELLRRIGLGILQNPTVHNRDILVFCYELIQEVYKASATTDKGDKTDPKLRRFLINRRGAAKSGARLSTSSYIYKMTRFSLDILRTVLRKHDDLQAPQNMAGFLPIIGDCMVQGQEEVQVSAVRLLTTIIKVPMDEMDANCAVYVDEAVRAIKGAHSSNTELAQASLKLVAAVLRERPNVLIRERDVGHLIKRLLPDLDELDRQGVSFAFLKAVMSRHIDVPEVYEAMDKVAEMTVTNQTRSARDLARSHYFQFLTSYTQSEKRFKKSMEFLLKNLRYEHVEGRQSVMEALDLVITKALPRFPEKAQYDYHGMMFLPLINTLANDDSSKCRELASLLVKRLFQHASEKRLQTFTADLKSWLEQDENTGLKRLGIQCFGFYFEELDAEDEPRELSYVLEGLDSTIDESLARRDEDDWELLYYSLTLVSKICKKYQDAMLSADKESLWTAVQASVSYPHAWVKLKAAELMGTYFAHLAITNKDVGLGALPLKGSGGLQLAEQNMIQLTNASLRNLFNSEVSEQLCTQTVKNIAFLARCLAVNGAKWQWHNAGDDDEAEEVPEADGADGDASSDEDADTKKTPPAAIHRLMIRLSGLIRRETSSMNAKASTMNLLETMAAKFPLEPLSSSLPHLLTTLNTLVDPATTIPRAHTNASSASLNEPNELYKSLIDKAREIMNALQKRMGTQEYLKVMGDVQKAVRDRRDERRRKRKVEAVADPEKWGREKKRRNDVKRVKRKEKGAEHRGQRRGW
ncbi:armadillo-type protein [Boeremia exigua]|uniref:armadillo-type protein n=1 Tax=Boeremia exigua TaxID=749465 RepID=UPI001E8EAE2E|nr:armadillo-type protein [Boeremia exigua]KAH6644176.1 armadillo-type protein [Boeremia exigua]